jgi:hypothetical protein
LSRRIAPFSLSMTDHINLGKAFRDRHGQVMEEYSWLLGGWVSETKVKK